MLGSVSPAGCWIGRFVVSCFSDVRCNRLRVYTVSDVVYVEPVFVYPVAVLV